VPKGLPGDPNDPAFTEAVIEAALPVLEASGGRAFLLFTTLRALRRAHELLKGRLSFPLLVQGTGSRSDLLHRFRTLGSAGLLGSQSFWEGVDVRGEALSLVVIDKLPFAPPDPGARGAHRGDAPRAATVQRSAAAAGGAAAKQGGRLIRDRRPRRADVV
jgi:ATP-dependent DNA helicase DinG